MAQVEGQMWARLREESMDPKEDSCEGDHVGGELWVEALAKVHNNYATRCQGVRVT